MDSKLITKEGYEQLKKEYFHLWRKKRPEITKKVSWAASLGDRSENADYQYNKKLLREIDYRIRYLTKCLNQLRVVEYSPEQEGKVFFGATVIIEDDNGVQRKLKLVGYDEILNRKNVISIESPMAKTLLKKQVGEVVYVKTPKGNVRWMINDIYY